MSTVARRQLRLIFADRGYFTFLALLPFILGTLSLLVPGQVGLGTADVRGRDPNEPAQILMLLNISAVFMGTALTIRDLVGERTIFRREQAVGLSASAYLVAKIAVYVLIAAAQSAVLTAIVVLGKGAPTRGAVILGHPVFELYVTLAATAAVAAIMGLTLSAAAKSQDQILPTLVVSVMLSIVFSGRAHSGHRPARSRSIVVGGAGTVGLCRLGVHHRSAQHRAADTGQRDIVVPRCQLVAGGHDDADHARRCHDRRHPVANPTQCLVPNLHPLAESSRRHPRGRDANVRPRHRPRMPDRPRTGADPK